MIVQDSLCDPRLWARSLACARDDRSREMTEQQNERALRLHDDQSEPGRALYRCDEQVGRAGLGAQELCNERLHFKVQARLPRSLRAFSDPISAITREKEIKAWRREKKNELVRKLNPKWEDLSRSLFGDVGENPPSSRQSRNNPAK